MSTDDLTHSGAPGELEAPGALLAARLHRAGQGFLAEFLEVALRHRPLNVDALAELGHVYTSLGRHREGLEVDRRLVRLVPDNPTVHYNLACSLALVGDREEALTALEAAVEHGYVDVDFLLQDEDLKTLRGDPRFLELVERLREA